jgi:hypothetical protein
MGLTRPHVNEYELMRRPLSVLALLTVFVACQDSGPPTLALAFEPMESPAGGDSAEPFLSASKDAVYLSWLERTEGSYHELRFSQLAQADWTDASVVAGGDSFFVNWADFPSVSPGPQGTLWAHWLQRGDAGGYDYGVRVAHSADQGATWSEAWTPHEDGTPTEHGFVSVLAMEESVGFVWLDGRKTAGGEEAAHEMTLRFREIGTDGTPGPETLLDGRTCDCCQTDATVTPSGPVVLYRDRTQEPEVRDIYITRYVDGAWTEGVAVHDDGWHIWGCPVNGPSAAMAGGSLAVAWFTGAGDEPRVKIAFSEDDGATFGEAVVIDGGNPAGRVAVVGLEDGTALVGWLERTGGEGAEVRMRRIRGTGEMSESVTLTASSSSRASGFPQLVQAPDGSLLMAWTDVSTDPSQVRVSRLLLEDR